ncbi:MAG: T9SS type A sorting domain-containing protein [Bacteroidetes bacterium]|nr:T9SS type A sorting domain-containing protein [Bacteroidota bacterium]
MRKLYILAGSLCVYGIAAAQVGQKPTPTGTPELSSVKSGKVFVDVKSNGFGTGSGKKVQNRGVNYANHIYIGASYYDLQTNYAMPHRLVLHNDGAVSGTWTTSPNDASGFPQRGSGYNFRNTSGTWLASQSSRIETVRTGWPNLGVFRDGTEFIIGHEATNGGFYISRNTEAGTRPDVDTAILREEPYKPIWGRAANSGDTIHMIYSYTDSAAVGEKRAPTRLGIFAPMVYSRSTDKGKTWDIQHIMLPGYDSTLTNNGGSDQYAIDCRNKTVVIVNADNLQGVIAWKSTDAGRNWQRYIVDTFAYAPYNSKKLMLDTPVTNDGTVDVILDKDENMHVFWGVGIVLDTDTTDESYSFFPGTQSIGYWNELTRTRRFIASGAAFDRTGDNTNTLASATFAALGTGSSIPSGLGTVARLGNTSAMRQPNAAIDENDNIYCIFSVPLEQDLSDLGANYRDIGIVYSKDFGNTWGTPQNITQVLTREDDFGCVARKANGFLHVMWQQDELPGTNLQNNSTTAGNHPPVLNNILYQAIPVSDILNGNIGMVWGVKTDEPNTGEVMVVNQNYPNPVSGTTNVLVWLTKPGDVTVDVRNSLGAVVKSQKVTGLNRGNHMITIDASGLAAGVYTYSLTSGANTISRTMMVK